MIAGYATTAGTERYFARFPEVGARVFGRTGLLASEAGFGCYRIDPRVHEHHHALRQAITSGINVIDTSTNYADGGSEQLVGHILGMAVAGGTVSRDEMIVVSKVGYLQGKNFEESEERKAAGTPWPDLVVYGPGLEHCIHPDFIEAQLTQSLERLNLETLDVLLLHNPEYYLGWASKLDVPLAPVRDEYYRRLRDAFVYLETEVERGRIRAYGVSSNTFGEAADDGRFTEITRLLALGEQSRESHLQVVQMPMNLLEQNCAINQNQPDGRTALAVAQEAGLAVLINRPLNAVRGNGLIRLADVADVSPVTAGQADSMLETVTTLEHEFGNVIVPLLTLDAPVVDELCQLLSVGHLLQERWQTLGTLAQWQQTMQSYVLPRLEHALRFLAEPGNLPPEGVSWLGEYSEGCNRAFRAIEAFYGGLAVQRAADIRGLVTAACPVWLDETLSRTAVRALRGTAGVTTVLVGMRQPGYVDDVIAGLGRPIVAEERGKAWEKLAAGTYNFV